MEQQPGAEAQAGLDAERERLEALKEQVREMLGFFCFGSGRNRGRRSN